MSDEKILVERRGAILTIGLNRPEKRNAIDLDMFFAMARAYGQLAFP